MVKFAKTEICVSKKAKPSVKSRSYITDLFSYIGDFSTSQRLVSVRKDLA